MLEYPPRPKIPYNWFRKSLAECVTTRGQTSCSPAFGTPPAAEDLTEVVAAVPAVVLSTPTPRDVLQNFFWLRDVAVWGRLLGKYQIGVCKNQSYCSGARHTYCCRCLSHY